MTVTSGFFNSVSHDRLYKADHFNTIFDGIIVDGVLQGWGDALLVEELPTPGMSVVVGSGKAWFNNSWLMNDADITVSLNPASPTLGRIDAIVMDFDKRDETRDNTIIVIEGTPAVTPVKPELTSEEDHEQRALAYVTVGAAVTEIINANIENVIGDTETPFATGLLEQLDANGLFLQWDSQFYQWFNNLQNELDNNQVTNLQNQIDNLEERPIPGRNLIINGNPQIAQRGNSDGPMIDFFGYPLCADMWKLRVSNCGQISVQQNNLTLGQFEYEVNVDTGTGGSPSTTARLYLEQPIEGEKLGELKFGSYNAKELQLSFSVNTNTPGTYVVELINQTSGVHFTNQYTLVSGENDIVIPIDADPLNDISLLDTVGLSLRFWLTAGSDYSSGVNPIGWDTESDVNRAVGQIHLGQTSNNYWRLRNVQLEVGSKPTVFESIPHDEELLRCQRYYEIGYTSFVAIVDPVSETLWDGYIGQINVMKPFTPTIVFPAPQFPLPGGAKLITAGGDVTASNVSGSCINATTYTSLSISGNIPAGVGAGTVVRGAVSYEISCEL